VAGFPRSRVQARWELGPLGQPSKSNQKFFEKRTPENMGVAVLLRTGPVRTLMKGSGEFGREGQLWAVSQGAVSVGRQPRGTVE
jgi:hypothetical protein